MPPTFTRPLDRAETPCQTGRLLALAAIYDKASRTEAAAIGGVTLQIVRDWVLKLNAGGPEALVDYKGPGPQPILNDTHRAALAQAIEYGPMPAIHGVVRWRVIDLVQWLSNEFQVTVSKQTFEPRAGRAPCPGVGAVL
jgi:transposase